MTTQYEVDTETISLEDHLISGCNPIGVAAKQLYDVGFSIIPIKQGVVKRVPVVTKGVTTWKDVLDKDGKQIRDYKSPTVPWEPFQTERADTSQIELWFGHPDSSQLRSPINIGVVCGKVSNIIVVDTDSKEAEEWVSKNIPETPMKVKTSKGYHRYYRYPSEGEAISNRVLMGGIAIDIRGDGGYVVAPPSVHQSGHVYTWMSECVDMCGVPVYDPMWFATFQTIIDKDQPSWKDVSDTSNTFEGEHTLKRAKKYLSKMKVSEGGRDNMAFQVASRLVRGFDIPENEALEIMLEWNREHVSPPLEEEIIAAKIDRARFSKEPIGHLNTVLKKDDKVTELSIQNDLLAWYIANKYIAPNGSYVYFYDPSQGCYMPRTLDDLIGDTANRFNAAGLVSKENNIVNLTKGTIRLLRAKTWGLNQTVYQKQRDEYIALNNGLISREDVLSGRQTNPIPFTSDIFCTYKLYLTWNPVLNTDSVIEHLLPMFEDEYERLEQFALFGKSIILGDNRHQKMLCLQGSPGSGKSALADILKSLVPNKYRTAITFSQFGAENSDYFLAQLENSLLNVGSEESHPNRKAVTLLKSVTGNDEISARPIGKEPIRFTPRVNMMFFANSKFSLGGDSSGAMNDRYLILKVNNRYRGRSHRIPFFAKYFIDHCGGAFVTYCLSRKGSLGDYDDNTECIEVDSYEDVARSVLRNGKNYIEDAVDSFRKYGWKKDIDTITLKKELQRIGWSVAPKKEWNNRILRGSLVLTPPPGFFICDDPTMEDEANTLPEGPSNPSHIDLPDILQS